MSRRFSCKGKGSYSLNLELEILIMEILNSKKHKTKIIYKQSSPLTSVRYRSVDELGRCHLMTELITERNRSDGPRICM